MRFNDIPQFPRACYEIDVSWGYLKDWLESQRDVGLELDPDFQRAHVWSRKQQTAYIEYVLKGGEVSQTLYWNHPSWMAGFNDGDKLELVDGKQRLTAVLQFLDNQVKAFGLKHSQFEGKLPGMCGPGFKMRIARLKSKAEVLEWYLGINAGGTPHSKKELDRVEELLKAERCSKS